MLFPGIVSISKDRRKTAAEINKKIEFLQFPIFLIKVGLGHEFELKWEEEKAQNQ